MKSKITLFNVGTKTTYEIRQEIDQRKLAVPEKQTYQTLLQCLVKELMKDRAEAEKELFEQYEQKQEMNLRAILEQKAERKARYLQYKTAEKQGRLEQQVTGLCGEKKEEQVVERK